MASREEEKRRRREERVVAEREAAARAERTRRLRLGGGVALLAVVVVAVVIAVVAGGGSGGGPKTASASDVKIPPATGKPLKEAAAAAGCSLKNYPSHYEDRGHVPDTTKVKYLTNPPAFGKHYEIPASDGDYVGQGTPSAGHIVHSLEHGRIEVQYRPGLPTHEVRQLEALFDEKPDLMLLFQNATGMKEQVAAVAWTHIMSCPRFDPQVFDAIRAFRDTYKLKGPEVIPQPE